MDPKPLFPEGHHPQKLHRTLDGSRWATVRHRYQAPFPKYYIIDFGISTWFREAHEGSRLVVGTDGQNQTVPELHDSIPYDPFKVDIYTLGHVFNSEILMVCHWSLAAFGVLTFW